MALHHSWRLILLTLAIAGVGMCLWLIYRHNPHYGLPFSDRFHAGGDQGWIAFGGTWQLSDGAMQNISDERGAKLVTGSPFWTDYAVDSDLRLEGTPGDAGLILRVQEPDQGIDAFQGFYTGLRLRDNALIAGQADYGWTELAVQPLSTKLQPFTWYHLHAAISACRLSVAAFDAAGHALAHVVLNANGCSPRGEVGLRSFECGGSWRSFRVSALQKGARSYR